MQTISTEYRKLNEKLHENPEYGASSVRHVQQVLQIAQRLNTTDILDYGCGKSCLARNLPFAIKEYDPAIPKFNSEPEAADIVVCTDVLEHIEPEFLDNVLAAFEKNIKKVGFFTISTRPAKKILADGRNAHLIVQPAKWWIHKLYEHFDVISFTKEANELIVIVEQKESQNA